MIYNGNEYDAQKGVHGAVLKFFWKKIFNKFIDEAGLIASALTSYYTKTQNDASLLLKLNKAKGGELSNLVQSEVFNAMLRLQNRIRTYVTKTILEAITGTFTGGIATLKTTDNLLIVFSYLGVRLKGKSLVTAFTVDYASIVDAEKDELDFIRIESGGVFKIYFNPLFFTNQEASDCTVLVENKITFTEGDLTNFLAPVASGGVGNAGNTTAGAFPAFTAGL